MCLTETLVIAFCRRISIENHRIEQLTACRRGVVRGDVGFFINDRDSSRHSEISMASIHFERSRGHVNSSVRTKRELQKTNVNCETSNKKSIPALKLVDRYQPEGNISLTTNHQYTST